MQITSEHAAAYIKAKGCTWLRPEDVLASAAVRHRAAAFIGAGPNIMDHHRAGVMSGGMEGGLEVVYRLYSAEHAKFSAGSFLCAAREHRLVGDMRLAAILCLERAAMWRRVAQRRTQGRAEA